MVFLQIMIKKGGTDREFLFYRGKETIQFLQCIFLFGSFLQKVLIEGGRFKLQYFREEVIFVPEDFVDRLF